MLINFSLKSIIQCVQLTTVRSGLSQTKQEEWLSTLQYWKIKRGLFIDFNPSLNQVELKISKKVFEGSDRIQENCYAVIKVDR